MTDKLPETGWDFAAQLLVDSGVPLDEARDIVIGFFLKDGDMRAFSDWVLRGHVPKQRVLQCIALMACESISPEIIELLPFALVRKKRGGGKKNSRPNPEQRIFEAAVAGLAHEARGNQRGQYEAAIMTVVELLGERKKHQTVRDAYDQFLAMKRNS